MPEIRPETRLETGPEIIAPSQFTELFLNDTPLLDVRAPVEFARGAFPTAVNLPLLDDEQRQAVGIRYKQAGPEAAIALGHELVNDPVRRERMRAWKQFINANPDALLYCFRGGQRSKIVQNWLQEDGLHIPRIPGGYKALRRFLITTLEQTAASARFILVAGKTGSAKTHLINQLRASVDLEGRANHRGSAFGTRASGQPGQVNFENRLAIDFLKLGQLEPRYIFLEDESRAIGSLSVPPDLFASMHEAPLAVIEETLANRVDTILDDYIRCNYQDFLRRDPDRGDQDFRDFLTGSLDRIKRRLGGDNFKMISKLMAEALAAQGKSGDLQGHRTWIEKLLTHYYDPMYDFQLGKKQERIVFRGDRKEFLAWAGHLDQRQPENLP